MNSRSDQRSAARPIISAAVVGIALLAAGGVAHRMLKGRLDMAVGTTKVPPGTLAQLPLKLPGWTGKDVPMDEEIIKRTDTDDHIRRLYRRTDRPGEVGLFVGAGVRARDLMPHRPEVCYPGAGWTLTGSEDVVLPLPDDDAAPAKPADAKEPGKADGSEESDKAWNPMLAARILRFTRTGLTASNITVLNYYIINGDPFPDVSYLRKRVWSGSKGIRYMAQVQVTCSDRQALSDDQAERSVRLFAALTARDIRNILAEADRKARANADAGADQPQPGEESRE